MADVQEILAEVEFKLSAQVTRDRYVFDEMLGFLARSAVGRSSKEGPLITVLGFCVPYQESPDELPDVVVPRVNFSDLPPSEQIFGKTNRGTGPRLYPSSQALRGTREDYGRAGVYEVTINEARIADRRHRTPTKLGQIAKAGLYKLGAGDLAAGMTNFMLGDVDAAIWGQPPDSIRLQRERGVVNLPGVIPEILIIRNLNRHLRKVGDYRRPG